jgi:S-adenosylmethionine:tRNA ribosyltransferase-isomerase
VHRFDYELPERAVAQTPAEPRDSARMLVALDDVVQHRRVRDLPDLLEAGDALVVNDTKVLPARLRLRKQTGGVAEVLLLEPLGGGTWSALVRPGRRLAPGTTLVSDREEHAGIAIEIGRRLAEGRREVHIHAEHDDPESAIEKLGEVPLPPYIRTPLADAGRYQTVYASRPASVAAPTAGLHLTHEVLDRCRARGVEVVRVELAVGLDTFRPVTALRPEDHRVHTERYRVTPEAMAACAAARRVVAVGTTTVRALESAAAGELEGRTSLFIHGRYEFRLVDVLLTNFHLPRSSLLLLLDAFAGDRWRALYDTALAEGYRFLSFGDCMLVSRRAAAP